MLSENERQRQRRWSAHCLRMAEDTRALATRCEDLAMTGAYADLAAAWISLSTQAPPREPEEDGFTLH